MVDYANKKYSNPRLQFKTLDFSTKNIAAFFQEELFSKIFSFFCLHFIQDQKQVAKNIFSLLRPGGEFLIVSVPTNKVFTIYKILSEMERWKDYMKDIDDVMPSFHFSINPSEDIKKVFISQGLEVFTCEEREETISFPNRKIFRRSYEAVNPFVKRMDLETKAEFVAAFIQVMEDCCVSRETISGEILAQNHFIVIHGRRPHNDCLQYLQ